MNERIEINSTNNRYIFIANHEKWIDHWIASIAINQSEIRTCLRPLMAQNLSRTPLGLFLRLCGAFPVKNGQGVVKNLETPARYLEEGHSILIYPQGAPNGRVRETRPGAKQLSLQTQIPIFPMLINAPPLNFRRLLFENHQIEVTMGQPFMPGHEEDVMGRVWQLAQYSPTHVINTGFTLLPKSLKTTGLNIKRLYLGK